MRTAGHTPSHVSVVIESRGETGAIAFGPHWSRPSAGIVRRDGDSYRLEAVHPVVNEMEPDR